MNVKSAVSIILVVFMVACVSVPHENFQRIEIVTYDPESIVEDAPSKGEAAAAGAAIGAAGGLFYTALFSLACGPAFAVCFAGSAPVVVGASAVGGGVAGAVAVSRQDLDAINEFIDPVPGAGELNQELAKAVAEFLEPARVAEPGTGDARLSLGLVSLKVSKIWGKVHLSATARVLFNWHLGHDEPGHVTRSYSCITSAKIPGDWPENSSELVRGQLDYCIRNLAQQVHNALSNPPDSEMAGFSEEP